MCFFLIYFLRPVIFERSCILEYNSGCVVMYNANQPKNYTQIQISFYTTEDSCSTDGNLFYNGPEQLSDSSTLFDLRQFLELFRDTLFSTWMTLEQLQDLPSTSKSPALYEELDHMNLTFFNAWIQFRRLQ